MTTQDKIQQLLMQRSSLNSSDPEEAKTIAEINIQIKELQQCVKDNNINKTNFDAKTFHEKGPQL